MIERAVITKFVTCDSACEAVQSFPVPGTEFASGLFVMSITAERVDRTFCEWILKRPKRFLVSCILGVIESTMKQRKYWVKLKRELTGSWLEVDFLIAEPIEDTEDFRDRVSDSIRATANLFWPGFEVVTFMSKAAYDNFIKEPENE